MAAFMMISMSLVHSPSVELLRRTTSVIRYERRKNSVIQKVLDTTHTSLFMISVMSAVHSVSLILV